LPAQVFLVFLTRAAVSVLELAQVLAFDERYGLPNRDGTVVVSPNRQTAKQRKESPEFHAWPQSIKLEKLL
jgi:hypothetical protein